MVPWGPIRGGPKVEQRRLTEAVKRAADPMHLMQRVADEAVSLIAGADGALIALWDEGAYLVYVCGAGYLEPSVGIKVHVANSLSGLAVRSGQIFRSDDTSVDDRVDAESCRQLDVISAVCVPLVRSDKSFGVLNVSSRRRGAFSDDDVTELRELAEFVSLVVGAATDLDQVTTSLLARSTDSSSRFVANVLNPHAVDQLEVRARIQETLEQAAFSFLHQPVVDLSSGETIAVEALARFSGPPHRTPDVWFAEAHEVGLGVELELAAVEKALATQKQLPGSICLAVNCGPTTVCCPEMVELLSTVDGERVIVELTEHVEVTDYPCLIRSLTDIRSTGARLAIDDTGAGISSLAHILKLAPEIIKLDRALTTQIDRDPARRALASSLVTFATEIGATIIAEGIENANEFAVLRELGIALGQGYFLARPAPLSSTELEVVRTGIGHFG
jgi:EAL domain-containing protein (putative c-di-GMP-specific phosphodiesterase class I)